MSPVRAVAMASSRVSTRVTYANHADSMEAPGPRGRRGRRRHRRGRRAPEARARRILPGRAAREAARPDGGAVAERRRAGGADRRVRVGERLALGAAAGRLAARALVLDRALELRERAPHVAAHDRARELLGQPGPDAAAGDAVLEAQLHAGAAELAVAQPPAAALVDAGDRRPGQVALLVELHDL